MLFPTANLPRLIFGRNVFTFYKNFFENFFSYIPTKFLFKNLENFRILWDNN